MNEVKGAILPFPGGIVRSGSKVGSHYKALHASTNDAFARPCAAQVATALDDDSAACWKSSSTA